MERQRKRKFIIMIALMVAISAMSLGFAAFSATLNISSSASVSPDEDAFVVHIHSQPYHASGLEKLTMIGFNGADPGSVTKYLGPNPPTVPLFGYFSHPGQYIEYTFYIVNEGSYDVYINGISFNNYNDTDSFAMCTPNGDNPGTKSLVDAACDDFSIVVDINGTILNDENTKVSGHKLSKGEAQPVKITLSYDEGGDIADGKFSINFGTVAVDFSTVENEIITFFVNGIEYQAIEGMKWSDFINSNYNIDNIFKKNEEYGGGFGYNVDGPIYNIPSCSLVYIDDTIVNGGNYGGYMYYCG